MTSIFESTDGKNQVYYYNEGIKEFLIPLEERLLIGLKSQKGRSDNFQLLKDLDPQSEIFDIEKTYPDQVDMVPSKFIIADLKNGWKSNKGYDIDSLLDNNPAIEFISPLYKSNYPDVIIGLTLDLFVKTGDKEFPGNYEKLNGIYSFSK